VSASAPGGAEEVGLEEQSRGAGGPAPRPVRVLMIVNSLETGGGTEHSIAELLPALRQERITITVACLETAEDLPAQVAVADVRVLGRRSWFGSIRALRRLIRAERPDVVHTSLFNADVLGRVAAAGTGVPVLSSLVNTSYDASRRADPELPPRRLRLAQAIDGWTARHLTARFHAVTGPVGQSAVVALGIDPGLISVVARGRDPVRLGEPSAERRRRARVVLGLTDDDEVIVNVGRLEYQKGQVALVGAVAALVPRRPRLRLLIAGRAGRAVEELRSATANLGVGDHVSVLGHREDVPDLLAAADVFALPSRFEGAAGAVIEAMALGLPIVASALPTMTEVVEEGGNALLVPPGDVDGLAIALDRLLEDKELAQAFGRRSRDLFEARYTLARSARGMAELYREVARP
jgi:glycosyltransferase involved in cell wall biosynthesis